MGAGSGIISGAAAASMAATTSGGGGSSTPRERSTPASTTATTTSSASAAATAQAAAMAYSVNTSGAGGSSGAAGVAGAGASGSGAATGGVTVGAGAAGSGSRPPHWSETAGASGGNTPNGGTRSAYDSPRAGTCIQQSALCCYASNRQTEFMCLPSPSHCLPVSLLLCLATATRPPACFCLLLVSLRLTIYRVRLFHSTHLLLSRTCCIFLIILRRIVCTCQLIRFSGRSRRDQPYRHPLSVW